MRLTLAERIGRLWVEGVRVTGGIAVMGIVRAHAGQCALFPPVCEALFRRSSNACNFVPMVLTRTNQRLLLVIWAMGISVAGLAAPEVPSKPIAVRQAQPPAQGVVRLLRSGKRLAVGFVLARDGRIVTASRVGSVGDTLDIFYEDGKRAPARVGHVDAALGVAVVVPLQGWTTHGFAAGDGAGTQTFRWGDGQPKASPVKESDGKAKGDGYVGAPVLNAQGAVVGVVTGRTGETLVVASANDLRGVLGRLGPDAALPRPWLGLTVGPATVDLVRGVRVSVVEPKGPADGKIVVESGRESDLIVAVGGKPCPTPEAFWAAVRGLSIGERTELIVLGRGRYRVVEVVAAAQPAGPRP